MQNMPNRAKNNSIGNISTNDLVTFTKNNATDLVEQSDFQKAQFNSNMGRYFCNTPYSLRSSAS